MGADKIREQEKLEARKMLENAAESHTSGAPMMSKALILYGRTWLRSENALLGNLYAYQNVGRKKTPLPT